MRFLPVITACSLALLVAPVLGDESASLPKAFVDGVGPGWVQLGENDFTNVNCNADTWSWTDGVVALHGSTGGRDSFAEAVHEL